MSGAESSEDVEAEQPEATASTVGTDSLASLAELNTIADLDVEDHPDVYQRIHADLQGALASIDDA